ncbi:hypothetical protein [Kitasatospora sp. NPDC059462]|uniref:hypothetical protein n=1 Tax=Kitasatospora sp. NPDC059462 TaxID=3346841 RepID=UPI0036CF70D7
MRLTMPAVEAAASTAADAPPPTSDGVPFRWPAHHVREGVVALLPKGLDIDGCSKIRITCAPGRAPSREHWQALGASEYVVENVDLGRLRALPPRARDTALPAVLEDALVDLAGRHNRGAAVEAAIRGACATLRHRDFGLELPVPRLARSSPDRAVRARVVRCLNREVGEAWRIELTSRSGAAPEVRWMTERPNHLDLRDVFASSEWSDRGFVVRNRLGRISYELARPAG